MKPIINKILPLGDKLAIVVFGLIFAKRELNAKEVNHERIHIRQGNEMLWLFFYLWYGVEYLIKRLFVYGWKNTNQAYRNISFEREAYSNQSNLNYLNNRKWHSWVKYIKRI